MQPGPQSITAFLASDESPVAYCGRRIGRPVSEGSRFHSVIGLGICVSASHHQHHEGWTHDHTGSNNHPPSSKAGMSIIDQRKTPQTDHVESYSSTMTLPNPPRRLPSELPTCPTYVTNKTVHRASSCSPPMQNSMHEGVAPRLSENCPPREHPSRSSTSKRPHGLMEPYTVR